MISYIAKLFSALNANVKPSQIAHAMCLGLILGFVPKNNLLWYMLFIFFLFVRINKSAYFLMTLLGLLVASRIDPLFDALGFRVLTFAPFEPIFSWLLDIPFVGFTRFNNTVVCGSLVAGLIAYIPLFVLAMLLIKLWRASVAPALNKGVIAQAIKKIPLIEKIAGIAGGA
ncbi:MAG: TIGR03546 family protein [Treponema sp.]|nr:TIGR03546 family protein [Treponema sp.]